MKSFTAIVALAIVAVVAANPTPVEERQLGGLPSIVCLTGPLSGIASGILSGVSVVDCAAGQTCTALDIPIVGSLLPIGVSTFHCGLIADERLTEIHDPQI